MNLVVAHDFQCENLESHLEMEVLTNTDLQWPVQELLARSIPKDIKNIWIVWTFFTPVLIILLSGLISLTVSGNVVSRNVYGKVIHG